jgi:hypothetical protein
MFEHGILSHDDKLSLPHYNEEVNSMVSLKDTIIYLRDKGRVLSYSLTERSWDANISTPEEAARGYQLAVYSNNLVLVGGYVELNYGRRCKTFTVWVRQGNEWNADIIPPVPASRADGDDEILSAAGYDNLLFVLCYSNPLSEQNTCILHYFDSKQWRKPLKGPSFTGKKRHLANIMICGSNVVYAMLYSTYPHCKMFFRGHVTLLIDGIIDTLYDIEWKQLCEVGTYNISRCAYLTVFGDNMIIAVPENDNVELYSPFKDASIVDIGEFNFEFKYPVYGVIGLSDGSLVVIGDAHIERDITWKSAVVQFKSRGTTVVFRVSAHA